VVYKNTESTEKKDLLFKNKKYLGRLGNLVLICEILWFLSYVVFLK